MTEKLPTIFIIFGATGDLARRKLIPGLFHLHKKNLLPKMFQIVAFSRQSLTDLDFHKKILEALEDKSLGTSAERESFTKLFIYKQGLFNEQNGYKQLADYLGLKDKEWQVCANKLFYLAVPPQYYKTIFESLATSGLTKPCSPEEGWTRVLVEKPFGKDLNTAEELDVLLGKLFKEEQIYRIDHYLGRETVQNILAFRFSNSIFEPSWNKDHIESVRIQVLEKEDVESRFDFYDDVGALRDVGQNHLLQLLALFAMENPGEFDADSIRRERTKVLRALSPISPQSIKADTLRGQYKDYGKESGKEKSNTETYFHIRAYLDTPRFRGVPFYLESGKAMAEKRIEITVTFKHSLPCLCPPSLGGHYENSLRYHIAPQEGVSASFWVKKPGAEMILEEKDFTFDYKENYAKESFIDPYEKLCLDAISGNQTLFVSTDEIQASWKFVDPIVRAWAQDVVSLKSYPRGSKGLPLVGDKNILDKDSHSPQTKEIAIIGLGKMGRNLALRLIEQGWRVHGFDPAVSKEELGEEEIVLHERVDTIKFSGKIKLFWLMVPAGKALDDMLFGKDSLPLDAGDIVIDGGNSFYEDSAMRANQLKEKGVHFIDVGVSGGPSGARNGPVLMVGGEENTVHQIEYIFRELAAPGGYLYCGKSGAGHFVKMIHNGIEYGMMQAIAEGFSMLKQSEYNLSLTNIAEIYNNGSVIESRLMEWLKKALEAYGEEFQGVSGSVAATGEGEWTVKVAEKLGVPVRIIHEAVKFRAESKDKPSYMGKILSALRNQFGGHNIK